VDSLAPARSALWTFAFGKFLSPFPKQLKYRQNSSCHKMQWISPHQLHIAIKANNHVRIFQHEMDDLLAAHFKL